MKNSKEYYEQWKKVVEPSKNMKPLYGLTSLPAGDGNYSGCLRTATVEDLSTAISVMQAFPEGNPSRLTACQRRLNELLA